jgi:hypothetical protein
MKKDEILNNIPLTALKGLREFLNTKEVCDGIMNQLKNDYHILLEDDEYQISIKSGDDLNELKEILNQLD